MGVEMEMDAGNRGMKRRNHPRYALFMTTLFLPFFPDTNSSIPRYFLSTMKQGCYGSLRFKQCRESRILREQLKLDFSGLHVHYITYLLFWVKEQTSYQWSHVLLYPARACRSGPGRSQTTRVMPRRS